MNRAGYETTAATLSWLVKYMATDPDIQRRLHDEVCKTFSDELEVMALETIDDTEMMPILEAVTTETLRCATPAGGVRRRCQS
jgi:cytochrome P450